jgi:tetratricopeptide (TPR) repeat protein
VRIHRTIAAALGAAAVTLPAAFVAFQAADDGGDRAPAGAAETRVSLPSASTDERIAVLRDAVAADPDGTVSQTLLAGTYLQKIRETGDPTLYGKADGLLEDVLSRVPDDVGALTERGTLRLSRHDFDGGLADGRRALELEPELAKPLGVVVDGLVELGRYRAAGRALQRFVDRKPGLSSYTRASYFRELHGDLRGATRALSLAAAAGGGTAENTAFVQSLLGHVWFLRGDLDRAGAAYRQALARFPASKPARSGVAQVRAARGDLRGALRIVDDADPLLSAAIERRLGMIGAARAHERAALEFERFEETQGVDVGADRALLEAQSGDRRLAVRLGREAWSHAPSVRTAHALGWALTRAGRPAAGLKWARRSLRLGTLDPVWLYHAGVAALRAGEVGEAREYLRRSLARNAAFSPLLAPRAQRLLARLP